LLGSISSSVLVEELGSSEEELRMDLLSSGDLELRMALVSSVEEELALGSSVEEELRMEPGSSEEELRMEPGSSVGSSLVWVAAVKSYNNRWHSHNTFTHHHLQKDIGDSTGTSGRRVSQQHADTLLQVTWWFGTAHSQQEKSCG
jgi:hypothetical protein